MRPFMLLTAFPKGAMHHHSSKSVVPISAAGLNLSAWLVQVFTDAAAAQQARFHESPALHIQKAHAVVKHVMSEMASAEQEPSLAAATAAATALRTAHRAIAAEALLASLLLGLAETNSQVCACVHGLLKNAQRPWLTCK